MKSFVVDASVIIKWIFPEKANEEHLPQALNLLKAIKQNAAKIIQPPHWLAEAAAVIVRLQPKIAEEAINLLNALEFPIIETLEVYQTACRLSTRLDHHLFDTLYHATALCRTNTTLITADEQYYRKAHHQGAIVRLADFSIFDYAIENPASA